MKFKIFFVLIAVSIIAASCKDKKAAEDLAKARKEMATKDSMCTAEKQMLMDSIMTLSADLDSLMMPANATSANTTKSSSTKTTTTTTTTSTNSGQIDVNNKTGANTKIDVTKKEGANTKIDVKKKTGAVQTGTGTDNK